MKRAPIHSAIFAGAARRTDMASLAGALAMPGMVDAICTAASRQAPPKQSATATGGVGSIRSSRRPSGDGFAA
jgi:hypothetical protein